jgi:mono/diheme cytochrome c family protein
VLAITLAIAGCGGTPAGDGTDVRARFQTLCGSCHGPDGKPPEAMIARLAVRDLTAPEFRARVSPALVEHQIRTGSPNKLMPSFEGVIDDAQITALAAYVAAPKFPAPP